VSFVDILGFRNLVASANAQEILEVLRGKNILELREFVTQPRADGELVVADSRRTITHSFSDLVVNVTPMAKMKPWHRAFENFVTLGFRQFHLACSGIFVRGGITVGDIYSDDRMLFGPALIRAYDLERRTAKWPVLAIDPLLVEAMRTDLPETLETGIMPADPDACTKAVLRFYFETLIRKTDEGAFFLNYLGCMAYEDQTTGDLPYYLADHKRSVETAYAKYANYKYEFIATYHNRFCELHDPSSPALLIAGVPMSTSSDETTAPAG
jgi:hypothetical protein